MDTKKIALIFGFILLSLVISSNFASAIWFSDDYDKKREITNIPNVDVTLNINGTSGFYGQRMFITPADMDITNLAIYYNSTNTSNYTFVSNDITEQTLSTDGNLVSYWKFDNETTSGTTSYDSVGSNNGVITTATVGVLGQINESYDFGAGEYDDVKITNDASLIPLSFSVSAWVYAHTPGTGTQTIASKFTASGTPYQGWYIRVTDVTGNLSVSIADTNGDHNLWDSGFVLEQNKWSLVTITHNYSTKTTHLYLNKDSNSDVIPASFNPDAVDMKIGEYTRGDTSNFDGLIDEVGFWNRDLSETEVNAIYDNTKEDFTFVVLGEELSKEAPKLIANATSPDPALPSEDWQINITATDNDNLTFTAWTQFYVNDTISGSEVSQAINNNTNTNIASLDHNLFTDGANLIAEIWLSDNIYNTTKINLTDIADITDPVITTDNINLGLTYVYIDDNITTQINFSDPNLYSINISIDDVSIFNESGLNSSTYEYNLSQNVSTYGAGRHNVTARVCDGHTDYSIKDKWDYDIGLSGLTFTEDKKWYRINPTNNDMFEKISTTKLIDRYTFEYSKSTFGKLLSGDSYTFVVESSEYIDIINRQDSKYNAWLVIPTIGSTGRWIDFNLKDVDDAKYTTKRLNDKQVEVTISNIPKYLKEIVFESTGELNCVTENYEFFVFNYTLTHDLTALETSNQTYMLEITNDYDFISSSNATLIWNGTSYTPDITTTGDSILFSKNITMPTITSDSYYLFNWSFNVL